MKPKSPADEEARREVYKSLFRKAKISIEEYSLRVVWAGESETHPEGYITVIFTGDDLTFESLVDVSRFFGTRQIDISCDNGCSSDPCHERVITVYGALRL